jgi:hypothetical protein
MKGDAYTMSAALTEIGIKPDPVNKAERAIERCFT